MIDFKKLIKSFKYAFEGIGFAIKNNQNFRINLFLVLIAVILGLILKISLIEWSILTIVIALVLALETFNTAIEGIVNLIVSDYRKEAKFVKDVSAGMVLVAAIGSVIIALLIFLPHMLK